MDNDNNENEQDLKEPQGDIPQAQRETDEDNIKDDKKRRRKKKKKGKKGKKENEDEKAIKVKKKAKKSAFANEQFIINGNFNLIKMLGFGAFGEIHLAYDTITKQLRAIKFEIASHKNPQLKHEYSILEQLNKVETNNNPNNNIYQKNTYSNGEIIGIPKVYVFDKLENKYNYMVMDFLGPSISDLYQLREKKFTLETILMIGIQMLTRIEFVHEKGFLHRDIKPENFVIGINNKTNIIHIIDFGLSRRYKDKNSGQHVPFRENRHLVGTVRYASINAHLGIEQSRRDDIESIGYVLVYLFCGRLPWQFGTDKGRLLQVRIMEKKLITPPEILCKKMPSQFAYYFHYCRNLRFEDRPDYATLKTLFAELLYAKIKIGSVFTFDWFNDKELDKKENNEGNEDGGNNNGNNREVFDGEGDDGNIQSIFKNKQTPNPDLNDQYNPNTFLDKLGRNSGLHQNGNGITETLKINKILKDNYKGNENGIDNEKNSDSKSSDSESESEEESEAIQEVTNSEESKPKEKSSDSNYGILKSDSDSKKQNSSQTSKSKSSEDNQSSSDG